MQAGVTSAAHTALTENGADRRVAFLDSAELRDDFVLRVLVRVALVAEGLALLDRH